MYKKGIYKVVANAPLTRDVYRMVLEGDTQWIIRPGQFVIFFPEDAHAPNIGIGRHKKLCIKIAVN